MSSLPKLYTKHEFAEAIGKKVSYVEELCRRRLIEFTFVGREYRFTQQQFDAYVDACAVEAKEPEPVPQSSTRIRRKRTAEPHGPVSTVGAPVFKAEPHRRRREIPASVGGVA